ncbi:hypothetical protein C943_04507 [Mariniradius saccharolyticus AK6]|uniref:Uncharacterized protein n=1 Tax=Mariniradius saccharolyticus AK6 TaxID=1239962 RepID=M7XGE6_9BACT|nr:hypothetical protein [Mariniradius saccharolyticus]EMS33628.1 hypothetical protein C943_04507 [Mariniradius saccharolyticus AK6]
MRQNSITVVVPIVQGKVWELLLRLAEINKEIDRGTASEFEQLGVVHFARWLVIDHGKSYIDDPTKRHPKLVFVVDFDGNLAEFVAKFCSESSNTIDSVFCFCEGYPSAENRNPQNRTSYLQRNLVKDAAVYIGAPGRTVKQIKQERELRDAIRSFLDSKSWVGVSAKSIHQQVKSHVLADSRFDFLNKSTVSLPKINIPGLVLVGLILILLLPLIIVWLLIVHFFYEVKDKNFTMKRSGLDSAYMTELESYEDFKYQNQFSQLVDMKTGWVRLATIKAMFLLSRGLIKTVFVQGKLMGIPTIHFAKWVMFEDNSRVLFFSNFDGSWQQYLGDFIDNSGWGLTGIFSNTKVFPKTNFLLTGGAYDEEHFLAWSRNSQVVTQAWYAAYPDLSIKNVNNNTKIRSLLMQSLSERQAKKFLKLI